ncbi:hypothetical protein Ciccas_008623 [Cichlidogyrus casuarinus]|uniref:Uncharacterized protein n=1 Tax=Cichlidogyrus casuarinus TaxID=1844966 RepID=A0ABD2PZC7_9PLAT
MTGPPSLIRNLLNAISSMEVGPIVQTKQFKSSHQLFSAPTNKGALQLINDRISKIQTESLQKHKDQTYLDELLQSILWLLEADSKNALYLFKWFLNIGFLTDQIRSLIYSCVAKQVSIESNKAAANMEPELEDLLRTYSMAAVAFDFEQGRTLFNKILIPVTMATNNQNASRVTEFILNSMPKWFEDFDNCQHDQMYFVGSKLKEKLGRINGTLSELFTGWISNDGDSRIGLEEGFFRIFKPCLRNCFVGFCNKEVLLFVLDHLVMSASHEKLLEMQLMLELLTSVGVIFMSYLWENGTHAPVNDYAWLSIAEMRSVGIKMPLTYLRNHFYLYFYSHIMERFYDKTGVIKDLTVTQTIDKNQIFNRPSEEQEEGSARGEQEQQRLEDQGRESPKLRQMLDQTNFEIAAWRNLVLFDLSLSVSLERNACETIKRKAAPRGLFQIATYLYIFPILLQIHQVNTKNT